MCVESEGTTGQSRDHWYDNSCWGPRFKVEERKLRVGTIHVKAVLEVESKSVHIKLYTPVFQVRPETTEPMRKEK